MTDASSADDEVQRLKEQLRLLSAENVRLKARAAAALLREDRAEGFACQLEEELLLLRRRSLHWYLTAFRRQFDKLLRLGRR